uniref:ZP domain-containing protein n=1 Tax=Trichuris muris TaxID=70415 RepID=A0A5S6R465_TRIMR
MLQCVVVGLLILWPCKADRPFVKVVCSNWSIEATVGVSAQFSGQVVAEPKDNGSDTCLGVRSSAETFTLKLSAAKSPNCVQVTNNAMTAKLLIRRLWWVETVEDLVFAISCPRTNCSTLNEHELSTLPEVHMQIDTFEEGLVTTEPNQLLTVVALYPRGSAVSLSHCYLKSVDKPDERLDLIDEYGCAVNHSVMQPFQRSRANGIAESTLIVRPLNHSRLMMLQCIARRDSEEIGSLACLHDGWREPAEPLCSYTLSGLVLSIIQNGQSEGVAERNPLQCLWDVRLWPSIILSLLSIGLLLCDLTILVAIVRKWGDANRKNSCANLLSNETWPATTSVNVALNCANCASHSGCANDSSGISSYYSASTDATNKLKEKRENSGTDHAAIHNVAQVVTTLRRVRIAGEDYYGDDDGIAESQSLENEYEIPNCVISGDAKRPILS